MKNLTRTLAVSLSIGAAAVGLHAAPFLAVGDGAEVFFTGAVGARAESNIFLAANNTKSDTIFNLSPGLDFVFGKGSDLKGSLALVESFDLYSSNNGLNTHLFSADFTSTYDDTKTKYNFATFYHELNQNDLNIRGLARRNEFNINPSTEFGISEKLAVGSGVTVDRVDFKVAGFSNDTATTVPLNVYYKWTPKVDLSVGYRYRQTNEQIGFDETNNYFNVGARGEFTPKLSGTLDVGLENYNYSGGSSRNGNSLGFDADLAYEFTPKTSLTFGGSNSYTSDAFGARERSFSLNSRVSTKFQDELSGYAGLVYQNNGYADRTDKYYDGQLGVNYTYNTHVNLVASYDYKRNDSTNAGAKFNDNLFSVTANLRY